MKRRTGKIWRQLRAAFVVFHVLAIFILSLPSGSRFASRKRWRARRTQREFALWAERLQRWGVDTDASRLEARLWEVAQRYLVVQRGLARPFAGYTALGGMAQGWGMFRSPQRSPARLRVEVFQGHRWHTVYFTQSVEHDYLSRELEHNRMRKLRGRATSRKEVFEQLVTFIKTRLIDDFPKARRARISLERFDSQTHQQRAAGKSRQTRVQYRRDIRLEELRK